MEKKIGEQKREMDHLWNGTWSFIGTQHNLEPAFSLSAGKKLGLAALQPCRKTESP